MRKKRFTVIFVDLFISNIVHKCISYDFDKVFALSIYNKQYHFGQKYNNIFWQENKITFETSEVEKRLQVTFMSTVKIFKNWVCLYFGRKVCIGKRICICMQVYAIISAYLDVGVCYVFIDMRTV